MLLHIYISWTWPIFLRYTARRPSRSNWAGLLLRTGRGGGILTIFDGRVMKINSFFLSWRQSLCTLPNAPAAHSSRYCKTWRQDIAKNHFSKSCKSKRPREKKANNETKQKRKKWWWTRWIVAGISPKQHCDRIGHENNCDSVHIFHVFSNGFVSVDLVSVDLHLDLTESAIGTNVCIIVINAIERSLLKLYILGSVYHHYGEVLSGVCGMYSVKTWNITFVYRMSINRSALFPRN